jgi:hypothetical protein
MYKHILEVLYHTNKDIQEQLHLIPLYNQDYNYDDFTLELHLLFSLLLVF